MTASIKSIISFTYFLFISSVFSLLTNKRKYPLQGFEIVCIKKLCIVESFDVFIRKSQKGRRGVDLKFALPYRRSCKLALSDEIHRYSHNESLRVIVQIGWSYEF